MGGLLTLGRAIFSRPDPGTEGPAVSFPGCGVAPDARTPHVNEGVIRRLCRVDVRLPR